MAKRTDRSELVIQYIPAEDDGVIICRCEEITKGEIRRAVADGMYTMAEIRRYLRCTMGLCQGQTCGRLVRAIVAKELGIPAEELEPETSRAPMRPTELYIFANESEGEKL
mgnify:CR=1 FL=1